VSTIRIWTIGHSNRSLEAFLALLEEAAIRRVVDVRRIPASRRHPHFTRRALARALLAGGLHYRHMAALGGRRPAPASLPAEVLGLADPGLRAYASWMQGDDFACALERLRELARTARTAVLCAEADPYRCHRALLADALTARGVEVWHILAPGRVVPHRPTPAAEIRDGRVVYPSRQIDLL